MVLFGTSTSLNKAASLSNHTTGSVIEPFWMSPVDLMAAVSPVVWAKVASLMAWESCGVKWLSFKTVLLDFVFGVFRVYRV